MLRLEGVSKTYGRRLVLHHVDLRIEPRGFLLVVGPNASGKTTLLRLLSTYARPTTGRLRWTDQKAIVPEEHRSRIAYAGHQPLVYDELTARENIEFVVRMRGRPSGDAARRSYQWLQAFGLIARAEERVAAFSRGLRQRLALAQAFAAEPRLLLLDEPASNLDAKGIEALVAGLKGVKGAAAVVVATHDPDPFRPMADRTLEIRNGELRDWGRSR